MANKIALITGAPAVSVKHVHADLPKADTT